MRLDLRAAFARFVYRPCSLGCHRALYRARSIEQLVLALAEFRTLGIDFVSSQEALDTSTPMGKAMFTIVGAIAELERNVIRERIMAGLEHARSRGTKSGRQIGSSVVVFDPVAGR